MKKFAVSLLFCGVSAFAGSVSYYTTGAFSGTDLSGSNLVNGGATISYQGSGSAATPTTVTANPTTGINLGQITVADPTDVTGTFGGTDKFTLTIWQTAPTGGSGSSSSSITGTVTGTSNNIVVTFSPTVLTIGGDTYTVPASELLIAPNSNTNTSGVTTLQGTVTSPEPATLGMLGASLIGLGIAVRRRRAA